MSLTSTRLALVAVALLGAGAGFVYLQSGSSHALAVPGGKPVGPATVVDWPARVSTLAGDGVVGAQDGPAGQARFADPFGLAIDAAGNAYVAEGGDNNRIRKLGADGVVATLAGGREGYADGVGAAAAFHTPSGVALDAAGNLYVADTGNHAIRKVAPDGTVTTLAGGGGAGFRDGRGRAAQFNGPLGVAVGPDGAVYVADAYNDSIRRVAPDGQVSTVAGNGQPGEGDGAALAAQFDTPCALAVDAAGQIFIADTGNDAIRKLGRDGLVSTLVRATPGERDGVPRRPMGLALAHDGFLYVSSGVYGRVLQLSPEGQLLALKDIDRPASPGNGDGSVRLSQARGIALARDGALYVADAGTAQLRRLAAAAPGTAAPALKPRAVAPAPATPMLWPLKPQDRPHEVVGLMGEVRGNFSGESRDHFHSGLDIQAGVGTPVLAIAAGKVSHPLANWGYGELNEGFSIDGLSYIHMRVGRGAQDRPFDARFCVLNDAAGKPERVRVQRGARFKVGDTVGSVNRMAHVHLDYRRDGGEVNPLSLSFAGLRDTVAPHIADIALYDAAGQKLVARRGAPLRLARALQQVRIVVDAYDQMDGNQARRRLGLYKLGYQLLRADGSPAPGFEQPVVTQVYDRLPASRDAVKLVYAASSGITVHGNATTRFLYDVNNTLADGRVGPGAWHIAALAPGRYVLRILAADYAGNVALAGRDLALAIE
ncbi:gluconolaconase [Janthinobacterium fluminis]|uniref:Gluconolaconase n=1 Tax=Janthinobacterium fluminis TaxID=2987524 RepID=A0ABT5K559_9BURK|nr:gluconolaconase [Janthinobacterium fluminis]MDC8759891.1 gluconolaconase [Janthinobacterium fluminis]